MRNNVKLCKRFQTSREMVRRALIIGLDGTRGDILEKAMFQLQIAPAFKLLCEKGTHAPCEFIGDHQCCKAHDGPVSGEGFTWVTGPGWCSVITGVNNSKHLVKDNRLESQQVFAHTSKFYPTIFKLAKNANLKTAACGTPCFLSAPKPTGLMHWGIIDLECGVGADGIPNVSYLDAKSETLDYRLAHLPADLKRDFKTEAFAIQHITHKSADLIFAHFDTIDSTGHKYGFGYNNEYLNMIHEVDAMTGRLINCLLAETSNNDDQWLVVVTSDHGGHDNDHDTHLELDSPVPFIVTVIENGKFSKVNGLTRPVRHFDVAPTVAKWLKLSVTPSQFDGHSQCI